MTTPRLVPIRTAADIGHTARAQRRARGMSQEVAARQAGVSRQWVNSFEQGARRAELGLVLDLFAALGLSLAVTDTEIVSPADTEPQGLDVDALLDSLRSADER